MEDGLLSLKWNNHKSTFFNILSNLRKKETYTDATIACEGIFFPVHRLVISTCSEYFKAIFGRINCKCPVIVLKDIKPQEIEALLDYMYAGEVDVKQSELPGLIKAAECLKIKGLAVPDEDPNYISPKKAVFEPDSKSPPAKRLRRSSENSEDSQFYYNKVTIPALPSHTLGSTTVQSVSVRQISTSAPSQNAAIDSVTQSIPISFCSIPRNSERDINQIKVEVDGDKTEIKKTSQIVISGSRTESQGIENSCETNVKSQLVNSYQEYHSNESTPNKVDTTEIGPYNGTELPVPGPSGMQGTSQQIMTWGDEENTFPQFLANEDGTPQQVCVATMDPEMVAVRMFGGSKIQVQRLQQQFGIDVINQPKILLVQETSNLPPMTTVECPVSKMPAKKEKPKRRKTSLHPQVHFLEPTQELQTATVMTSEQTTLQPLQAMNPYNNSIKKDSEHVHHIEDVKLDQGEEIQSIEGVENNNNVHISTPQDLSSRRLHVCQFCQYRTRSKVDLNKHVRVHTREKPYKCHICKYESGDRSNFKRHLNGVHKISDFDVPPLITALPKRSGNNENPHHQSISQEAMEIPVEELQVIAMPFDASNPSTSTVS